MEFKGVKSEFPILGDRILNRIRNVMIKGDFISGDDIQVLEIKLAGYVGTKKCVTCANGTDALILALMAIGVGDGDAVFVPSFSYVASASCISILGAKPIFVDIDDRKFNISPKSLRKAVLEAKKQGLPCKAIITVDLFGLPANYIEIIEIARENALIIIEDAAQGFGGGIGEKKNGSFGDINTTSFFPVKPYGCYGDGGAIFTNNDEWADKIWSLKNHGRTIDDKYNNVAIGFNSRLDTIQASVLIEKLDFFIDYELPAMNQIAQRYNYLLSPFVKIPYIPNNYFTAWAQYSILLEDTHERNALKVFLQKKQIPSMVYYMKPLHKQKALKDAYVLTDLKTSQEIADTILSIPLHPFLNSNDVNFIAESIIEFKSNKK